MAGTRLQIVGAFVLFTLLITPVAWHLTQVKRMDLPVSRIHQLSWQASRFGSPDPFQVDIYSRSSPNPAISLFSLPSSTSSVVYVTHNLKLNAQQKEMLQKSVELGLQATDDALKTLTKPTMGKHFSVFLLCDEETADSFPLLMVGKYRHAWSWECQMAKGDAVHSAIEKLMQSHVYPLVDTSVKQDVKTKSARRALNYRLRFYLLKENPVTPWKENLQTVVDQYLGRLVQRMEAVANFKVETQVVQYARLAKEITPSADGSEFYINAEDLKHFKSANAFLDASVLEDREQVLHFMAALPDFVHAPLYIRSADQKQNALATSFELPGWGIAVIMNPYALNETFTGDAAASVSATKEPNGIADWELDVVMRERFTKLMQSAIETLQSTVKLVEALPELSVLERVQTRVETAITRLEGILCDSIQEQQQNCVDASDLHRLLAMVRQASELTDAAYYDHTMIRQLYFPQGQMLGVYAPLLAPLILPFLLGLIREIKRFKAKRLAKTVKLL
ncbi:unnamed protein product [Peronospora destructor]|uniref:GPI transamidase component PIG-S n=1 Tax=Peronospora destructor TaxID=86335 RepID=A0AAV0UXT7_9STRA|nr:unnamed protein product [Peronospora destructor]